MRARYAYVSLAALSLVMAGLAMLFAVAYYHAEQGSQQRQAASEQASQQKQGQMLERKLCTSLDRLASLKPPAGSAVANPSRAFEQQQHNILAQLGPDVGCGGHS